MAWAKVILFERGDAWRRALRVCDAQLEQVVETRSLTECRLELQAVPASILGLAITPKDAAEVIDLLHELPVMHPLARAAVFVPLEIPFARWQFLQAGAVHVISQRRLMGEFAQVARKHIAHIEQYQTHSALGEPLEERFLAQLPL